MHTRVAVVAAVLLCAASANASITTFEIVERSLAFGGYEFPAVGAYEKLVGRAYGELDPNDPKNGVIVDVKLAPRNARGRIEYAFDFYLLKPTDLNKSNQEVRNALTAGARDVGATGRDSSYGYGIVQAVGAVQKLGLGSCTIKP